MAGTSIIHFQDVRAEDDDYIHAAISGTGAALEVTTGITNPDVARNTSITTSNDNSPFGIVEITGVNAEGENTSENIAIRAGRIAYGDVAWARISKIKIPAGVSDSDTVTVGISDKLGLGFSITDASNVIKKKVNNIDKSEEISGNVSDIYNTINCSPMFFGNIGVFSIKSKVCYHSGLIVRYAFSPP
ncbi:unnamed protein product [marine sediment metagenome]|uniref:Uncharacterized protein n=1 Tax=marine sediment metagenome TaxID=412755 RepID=X0Z0Q9_9ZZZZ